MGHWLDGLLNGSGGITVEWDGVPLTKRDVLAFGEQFEVLDDGGGEKTVVNIRFISMDGDVTEDSDENLVTTISGDDEDSNVIMKAVTLTWDEEVSEGIAQIAISGGELDGGALELRHNSKRVLLASAAGAVLGHSTSKNEIAGGVRLTKRSISSNVTLDTTTTDAIGWIDASGELNVTLPAPSVGRVFFFPTVGSTSPSIRRGSALINGLASHYAMPLDDEGGIGVAISDGTNWVVRSIFTPDTGGGTPTEPAMTFFPAVQWQYTPISGSPPQDTAGDEEVGVSFTIRPDTATVEITGLQFYWAGTTGQTVRLNLWDPLTSTTVAAKTVDVVTAGAGLYTGTFASAYTVPTNRYMAEFRASAYDLAGGKYTKINQSNTEFSYFQEAVPFFGGRRIAWRRFNLFHNGAGMPGSDAGNEWNLIQPVIQEI